MKADFVQCKLSGSSDKLYSYLINGHNSVRVGDRVVLPSKLKDDGTISLCIGTVEDVLFDGELPELPDGYKPIVQVIPAEAIEAIRGCFLPVIKGSLGSELQ